MIGDLRGALRDAIKNCPSSRYEIAGKMSHLLGETVTKEMIDSWTREDQEAESKEQGAERKRITRRMPSDYMAAFCVVTEDLGPLQVMGRLAGAFVFKGPDAMRAELRKIEEKIEALQAEKKKRKVFIAEMEKGDGT
jgi:hypothetical protein